MEKIQFSVLDRKLTIQRAYNSGGSGIAELTERIAYCNYVVADLKLGTVSIGCRIEPTCRYLQNRKIIIGA